MNTQTWTVKKPGGEDLGCIRKLIIDSHTRQLTFADIALTQTNQLVRLPWTELEARQDGIFLKLNEASLGTAVASPATETTSLDTLEVPIQVPGKIGQSRRVHPLERPSFE